MRKDLRNKEIRLALRTPLRSALVIVFFCTAFLMWLGIVVVVTKLLMG